MNKAFLRSGKLESYLPMGENGQAVYISALQLRETLRLRGKAHISQCLAIPQPNETGERIDWYSAIDGSVIPWSAASEEERTSAYEILKQNQADLLAFSEKEQQKADKESQLFGALLSKTIQFPDENHVFIVNGQPVITFWGFVSANQVLRVDPVACLKPAVAAPLQPAATIIPSVQETAVITERKRPWWRFLWWLLPLLLLLLAILFLRGCFSTPSLPLVNINTPTIEKPALPDPTLEKPQLPTVVTNGHSVKVPTGTIATGTNGVISGVDANGLAIDGTAIDPNTGLPLVDAQTDNNQGALPEGTQPPEVPPVDPSAQNEQPKTDNNKTDDGQNSSAENKATDNKTANNQEQPLPPDVTPPASANNTTPLTIPASALANGSTDFLNGQWRAGAGIQDQKTGKPLSLNYQLDNGKGQVVMTRSDGVTCKAPVNAAVNQGGLNINNQGQANCSDGSNYLMPNIICQPGSQNIADCQGKYDNSQPFPLSMKRENK